MNTKYTYFDNLEYKKPKVKIPDGCRGIERPNPPTYSYHYSNGGSQGALICETENFPDYYNPEIEEYYSAYSDRIASWDYNRFKEACKIGGGEQNWAYKLPTLSKRDLKEFAQIALNTPVLPDHVRIIHYYNVSSGYSCPVVVAIFKKVKGENNEKV